MREEGTAVEEEIIRALRGKKEEGIQALLRHHGALLRYVIAPILEREQDREECLSTVTLRVWEKIDTYDPARGTWTAWLTAIARNAALNMARGKAADTDELSYDLPAREPTPEEALVRQEQMDALRRAIAALAPKDRVLFYRKYYYRQSTAQIAREMGLSERAVEGRLYRTKKTLREKMGGEGHDGTGI